MTHLLFATFGHASTGSFVLFAVVVPSCGRGFPTAPAHLRDLFGTVQVGAIHGRLLTAWSAAGTDGPLIVNGFLDAEGNRGPSPPPTTDPDCWWWSSCSASVSSRTCSCGRSR